MNLVRHGSSKTFETGLSGAGPMLTSARRLVFKIKTNVKYNPKGGSKTNQII